MRVSAPPPRRRLNASLLLVLLLLLLLLLLLIGVICTARVCSSDQYPSRTRSLLVAHCDVTQLGGCLCHTDTRTATTHYQTMRYRCLLSLARNTFTVHCRLKYPNNATSVNGELIFYFQLENQLPSTED